MAKRRHTQKQVSNKLRDVEVGGPRSVMARGEAQPDGVAVLRKPTGQDEKTTPSTRYRREKADMSPCKGPRVSLGNRPFPPSPEVVSFR